MRFVLVTPSFYLDFERCLLLIESVRRYVPSPVEHVIIVSRDDKDLFARCRDERTRVIVQEDIVQERFFRLPFARRWRFNWKTLPVRGWIWQQLVKMSIANAIDADAYFIVDSDCFFVRPFDPHSFIDNDEIPLYREEKDWYRTHDDCQKWAEVSRRLLRLPPWTEPYSVGYVMPWACWRRDVLLKLQAHIANHREPTAWLGAVARNVTFSEYMLYGIYVEKVLGIAASGHYAFSTHLCHTEWSNTPVSENALKTFRDELRDDQVLVMINAKSETPLPRIRAVFGM